MNIMRQCKPSYLAMSLVIALTACNTDELNSYQGEGGKIEPGGFMYFFENGLPSSITTTSSNPLTISNTHYKDGQNALKWRFTPHSELVFSQDIGYKTDDSEITPYTFMAWVYNEIPSDQSLTFQFGHGDSPQSQFKYGLNFTGWREFQSHLETWMAHQVLA